MIRLALIAGLISTSFLRGQVVEETVNHAGASFRVVKLRPEQVQLAWKDANGKLFRSFDRVQADFKARGKTVTFLMNAGIYEPGGIPSGLHIEGGKILRPLNVADAPGNFFLKPNGVCTVTAGEKPGPFVGTSETWQKRAGTKEAWGIQSGPMLLIQGKRHPAFREGSESRLIRNGVGVDRDNRLVFAITAKGEMVNLWDFAGLFLKLGCQNALFLDGDISQMAVNQDKPVDSNQFGAMFVVAE